MNPVKLPGADCSMGVAFPVAKGMRVSEEAVACAILGLRVSVGQEFSERGNMLVAGQIIPRPKASTRHLPTMILGLDFSTQPSKSIG